MARPLFQLGPRLGLCGGLVRGGRPLCDVGTDHAYLPIWLIKKGIVNGALATDINEGPLQTAALNAARYGVKDLLFLRQSDGLERVRPEEADDVVIAGMGGELILRIVEETPWLTQPGKLLVLQPMSDAEKLRAGLLKLGFGILEEHAVEEGGRPYTAFSARYGHTPTDAGPLYPYIGGLTPGTEAATRYVEKLLRDLSGRWEGARRGRGEDDPETLRNVMEELRKAFL